MHVAGCGRSRLQLDEDLNHLAPGDAQVAPLKIDAPGPDLLRERRMQAETDCEEQCRNGDDSIDAHLGSHTRSDLKAARSSLANIAGSSQAGNARNRLLRVPEAAAFVGLSASMLNKMRVAGTGPRYVKLAAKAVGYWRDDLVSWLNSRVCYSTSEGANLK
jgi:predicted DNA-binding transcriptional regulator AlpA